MTSAPRYKLEDRAGKKKYPCPECGHKRMTRYVDTLTGELLPEQYGRCERENNCSPYHLSPYHDAFGKGLKNINYSIPVQRKAISPPPSFIEPETLKASLTSYDQNNLVKWLVKVLGQDKAAELVGRYYIETSKHRFKSRDFPDYISNPGSVVFWTLDKSGKIRSGKIMAYNAETGKRIKEPFPHITWVHTVQKRTEFNFKRCLFGEHLLRSNPSAKVSIVESEKSALICSAYFPNLIWLACGGLKNLSTETAQALAGRTVILYPDLKALPEWNTKAEELNKAIPGAAFYVSDLLEKKASEEDKQQGLDIADYLIRFDLNEWLKQSKPKPEEKAKQDFIPIATRAETAIKPNEGFLDITTRAKKNFIPVITRAHAMLYAGSHTKIVGNRIEFTELYARARTCICRKTHDCSISKPAENQKVTQQFESWPDIESLEELFRNAPKIGGMLFDRATVIKDFPAFIESHLSIIKANNGNTRYLPYLNRLREAAKAIAA